MSQAKESPHGLVCPLDLEEPFRPSPRPAKPVRRYAPPRVEALEARLAPAGPTFTVDLLGDANAADPFDPTGHSGDIRYCINQADQSPVVVTVKFASSIAGQTITLTHGELPVTAPMVIDGEGNNITVSGNSASRVFDVTGANDTISHLALTGGAAPGMNEPHPGLGASIYANGGTLTLNNDVFNNNSANTAGGAVYDEALGGSLTLNNDQFNGNFAKSGGGAVDTPFITTLAATGCYFNTNIVTNGGGGAIAAAPSNAPNAAVVLDSSIFTGNKSSGSGGAVSVVTTGGPMTLTVRNACAFTNNQVTGSGDGGAISTWVSLSVSGSASAATTFSGNSAPGGGGAIAFEPFEGSSMSLTTTSFTGNQASNGGAVYSYDNNFNAGMVTATVSMCLFSGNNASGNGGALWSSYATKQTGSASLVVSNSTFYQNTAADEGGGLFLQNSNTGTGTNTVALTSLTVAANDARFSGGGVWIDPGMTGALQVQIGNSIIAGNTPEGGTLAPDISGTVMSLDYNLIGIIDGSNGWSTKDYKGTSGSPLDPGLDPNGPSPNGGPTSTIALAPNSPAYRKGNPALVGTLDQRGYTRQATVSIGAYDPDATHP
jgi:predicted outer membrane repeat protein